MSTLQSTCAPRNVAISVGWRLTMVCILAMVAFALAVTSTPNARAQDPTIAQCNGVDNQGGRTVHCTVAIDLTGANATVTVTSCTGAGTAETCIGPTVSTQAVTAINQCNGSGNGGGATVKCDVIVTGAPSGTGADTISQCIGSGEGGGTEPTTVCIPSSTPDDTSADIQQCNSSGNGGGGTERVKCSVTPTSTTASLPTIEQCNGSGNGGGALVICTVTISSGGDTTGTPTAGGTPTATTGGGSVTPAAGGAPTATTGGDSGTPSTGGIATPPTGIEAPNTGSGTEGANGTGVSLLMLALAALGLSAIVGATLIRRPYEESSRAGQRDGESGDDSKNE